MSACPLGGPKASQHGTYVASYFSLVRRENLPNGYVSSFFLKKGGGSKRLSQTFAGWPCGPFGGSNWWGNNVQHKSAFMRTILISAAIASTGTALAGTELVSNGGFEASDNGPCQVGYCTTVTDWSVPNPNESLSYTFLFAASGTGSGDNGVNNQYGGTLYSVWTRQRR
jgi:hypothetical protein